MGSQRPPRRRVTMAEVAAAAGVSPTTVSHALGGIGRVDPVTRQRVRDEAARLGYVPNPRARALRQGRSRTLGIASSMHPAVTSGAARLGFFMELASSVAEVAFAAGYVVVLLPPMNEHRAEELASLDLDGVLVVEPADSDPVIAHLDELGTPYVTIGLQHTGDRAAASNAIDLRADDVAELMLGHLADRGAANTVMLLGDRQRPSYDAARRAYERLAAQHGWTAGIEIVPEADGEEGGYRRMREVLARAASSRTLKPVDAVVAWVDAFASGVSRAIQDEGLHIPHDVMMVTRYDGLRAQAAEPPITAVDLRLDRAAEAAVRVLLHRLGADSAGSTGSVDGPASGRVWRHPTIPRPRLVERASTNR